MQQPPSKSSRTAETITKIEAEISRNKHQIEQLYHRNTELRNQIKMLSLGDGSKSTGHSKSRYNRSRSSRKKSRHRQPKYHSPIPWTKIIIITLLIVAICGFLGFAIASMITRR